MVNETSALERDATTANGLLIYLQKTCVSNLEKWSERGASCNLVAGGGGEGKAKPLSGVDAA